MAGAGTGVTANPNRARRGKPRTQAKDDPTGYRASVRPYQLGPKVLKLVRTRIGSVKIGDLEIGKLRPLSPEEIVALVES